MSPERLLFINRLKIRRFSAKTIKNYEHALESLARYHNKSPLHMTSEDIEKYLLYMLEGKKLSPATVNLHIGAFKCFYKLLEPNSNTMKSINKVKGVKKYPTVLSSEEIALMIQNTKNIKHRALIALLYSSGIRLQECLDLHPADIDGKNKHIHVVCGKGEKERYTIISDHALEILREYYICYRPKRYLFEGARHKPYDRRTIGKIIDYAAKRCRITKKVTPHTLRHSFTRAEYQPLHHSKITRACQYQNHNHLYPCQQSNH